jgi:hypothetical protein
MAQKKEAKVVKVQPGSRKLFMLPYTRTNYVLIAAGFVVIVLGFVLMAGGRQTGAEFHPEEIYSARRITLAPIVVLIGFAIEVVAVMWIPRPRQTGSAAS